MIAATNQDLEEMVSQGKFRRDLFYRLNVIPLHIPPLRERREDIIPLARFMLLNMLRDTPGRNVAIGPQAEAILQGYDWPGNVRELSNVLERIYSFLDGETIHRHHVSLHLRTAPKAPSLPEAFSLHELMHRAESEAIRHALAIAKGNKARAAKLLGIHRTLLYKKMAKHGICAERGVCEVCSYLDT